MRVVLLILVGGGVLWFLIQGFGPSLARDAEVAQGPGVLLTERGSAGASGAAGTPAVARPDGPDGSASPVASNVIQPAADAPPAGQTPASVAAEAVADAPVRPPAADSTNEMRIASELVHRPGDFPAWREAHEAELPKAESSFALAIAWEAAGREAEALAAAEACRRLSPASEERLQLLGRRSPDGPDLAQLTPRPDDHVLMRGAKLALLEAGARAAREGARWKAAARAYSVLLLEELRAPWPADTASLARWSAVLGEVQQNHRWNPKGDWPSVDLRVDAGDSLISIRKRAIQQSPSLVTCTGLIARCNRIHGDVVQPGQNLRVPLGAPNALVDIDARWLLLAIDDEVLAAWPVGVGRSGHETVPGEYLVGDKSKDPTWFRAGQQPVPAGDARNPLGTRWIAWTSPDGNKTHLGFHGTRDPESVGQGDSEGCVRMLNTDVEELYELLPKGAHVRVQP